MPKTSRRAVPILAAGVLAATPLAAPVAGASVPPSMPTASPGLLAPLPASLCELGVYCDDDELGAVLSGSPPTRRGPGHESATGPAAVPQIPGSSTPGN